MLHAPNKIGTLRPNAKANNNAKENDSEPIAALAVRAITNASVQNGQTATVTFDPTKTNIGALTQAMANDGYPSTEKK